MPELPIHSNHPKKLALEKNKLVLEKSKLALEKSKLALEKSKLALEKSRLEQKKRQDLKQRWSRMTELCLTLSLGGLPEMFPSPKPAEPVKLLIHHPREYLRLESQTERRQS